MTASSAMSQSAARESMTASELSNSLPSLSSIPRSTSQYSATATAAALHVLSSSSFSSCVSSWDSIAVSPVTGCDFVDGFGLSIAQSGTHYAEGFQIVFGGFVGVGQGKQSIFGSFESMEHSRGGRDQDGSLAADVPKIVSGDVAYQARKSVVSVFAVEGEFCTVDLLDSPVHGSPYPRCNFAADRSVVDDRDLTASAVTAEPVRRSAVQNVECEPVAVRPDSTFRAFMA